MDNKLVPLMVLLLGLFLVWVVYAGVSYWRTRRAIAWNVVHAALTRRHLGAVQLQALDACVQELRAAVRMRPDVYAGAPAVVRFALDAMAMQRLGIAPFGATRPFSVLRNPNLARSVAQHIRVVRFQVESRHGVHLTELDNAPGGSP